jgi:hypothetical protein
MARDTLANAKQELYELFAADPTLGRSRPVDALVAVGFTGVSRGEPAEVPKPLALSVATAGVTPTDWSFFLRVYATPDDDPIAAQDRIDVALPAVDALLMDDDGFGPLNWAGPTWDDALQAFVATSTLTAGRQDYF